MGKENRKEVLNETKVKCGEEENHFFSHARKLVS
jgi:hypothetical protein